jgi:hypothetical protein
VTSEKRDKILPLNYKGANKPFFSEEDVISWENKSLSAEKKDTSEDKCKKPSSP